MRLLSPLLWFEAALGPPRADGRDSGRDMRLEPLRLNPILVWSQLYQRVQRDLHPRALALMQVIEVGKNTP
jgi:hypothetical protein